MRRVAPARAGEGTVRENTAPPRPHELHTTPLGAARLCKNLGFAPQDVMRQCIRCIAQPGAVYQRRGKGGLVLRLEFSFSIEIMLNPRDQRIKMVVFVGVNNQPRLFVQQHQIFVFVEDVELAWRF